MKSEDIDVELQGLRSQWGQKLKASLTDAKLSQRVASRLGDIQHKLQGVRYHTENYTTHEAERERSFVQQHSPPAGTEIEEDEPKLIFEIEGLLYQVKSTLDMLPQLLRDIGFRSVGDSFGDHGERLLRQLENSPKDVDLQAASLRQLILTAQERWIDKAIALRDQVAHHGMISGMASFVQSPYVGGGSASITYPTMPTGERVRTYVHQLEKDLRLFVGQFVLLALDCIGKTVSEAA